MTFPWGTKVAAAKRTSPPELPSIYLGKVTGWDTCISLCGQLKDDSHLVINVTLDEPIKRRTSVIINVVSFVRDAEFSRFKAQITAITKDDVLVLATISEAKLTALITQAAGNKLENCLLACQQPVRGRADIIALRFGSGNLVNLC
jgi:hypothetical protein